jgi:hypothetical protein
VGNITSMSYTCDGSRLDERALGSYSGIKLTMAVWIILGTHDYVLWLVKWYNLLTMHIENCGLLNCGWLGTNQYSM